MHDRLIYLARIAIVVFAICVPIADADQFDPIRRKIEKTLVEQQIPSLAVAVAQDGKIIWEEAFGWADRENRIRATEHTMYPLASISKPITATGLMVLAERGKLKLDDLANKFLERAKIVAHVGKAADATLRRLANHTSGLPLHYQFFYVDEPFRRPAMDESIRRYGHLVSAPGERYQYANFGYGILDEIIARESRMSYAEFMRREVFLPLGMTHTSVDIGPGLSRHQAIRYSKHHEPLPFYDFDHPGASAVFSSAHDLVRFGMFHLKTRQSDQKAILSDASIDEMQRGTADTGNGKYGVGWFVDPDVNGRAVIGHSGGMGGVRTKLTLVPKEKIAVVALCNFSTNLPMEISRDILKTLVPDLKKKKSNAKKTSNAKKKADEKKKTNETAPSEDDELNKKLIGHWSGHIETYQGKRAIQLWFKPSGNIHVKLDSQLTTLLNNPQLRDGRVKGEFASDIGTTDANRRPYNLRLDVKHRGDRLNGSVTALSRPGRRLGNALSYWIEVKRDINQ